VVKQGYTRERSGKKKRQGNGKDVTGRVGWRKKRRTFTQGGGGGLKGRSKGEGEAKELRP